MQPFYVVTSDYRQPSAWICTSLRDAKQRLGLYCAETGNSGEWVGYKTRADLHADRDGTHPHFISGTIDRVTRAVEALEEYPPAVCAVIEKFLAAKGGQ